MEVFQIDFSYIAPESAVSVRLIGIVLAGMVAATIVFIVAYFAGVFLALKTTRGQEARADRKKKQTLDRLLAMKAAEEELQKEIERTSIVASSGWSEKSESPPADSTDSKISPQTPASPERPPS